MMNQGDDQRDRLGYPDQRPGYPIQRRPANSNRYPEKNGNYSPSTSFKYNPQSSYSNQGGPQRKRMGSYDNNGGGGMDKIARQNDIIIRLLKEIRDHLVYGVNRSQQPAGEMAPGDSAPETEDKAFAQANAPVDENGMENPDSGNEKSDQESGEEQDA